MSQNIESQALTLFLTYVLREEEKKTFIVALPPLALIRWAALKQHLVHGESVGMVSPYLPSYIKIPNLTYKQWLDIDMWFEG